MRLSDKYTVERGSVYLTGIQALVRLPIDQMRRDRRAGLKTAAFISGYEGSPLGGYDLQLARSRKLLEELNVHFRPGLNEELAATSVMGSQVFEVVGKTKVDGVVGFWYGKGPGVDRSGDIFRHANMAGTGTHGGAVVLAGDDHSCKSSTIPHQSDFSLYNFGIPFLYPGNTQEIIDYGLLAVALSRYSGAWVGLKMVTDICDGGSTVIVDPDRPAIRLPEGYQKTVDARIVAPVSLGLEYEVNVRRLQAAIEFARLNHVNKWRGAKDQAWLGIASAGKSYYDLMQALRDLGIGEDDLNAFGIRIAKFGMTFPLDGAFAREFAEGLETVLVIEEKRSFLELHLRDALYATAARPVVIGKIDRNGEPMFPPAGELDPDVIATVVARVVRSRYTTEKAVARIHFLEDVAARPREVTASRPANFCSGCPHNRSTLLLPGQIAGGGIGCHTMAMRLVDANRSFSYMTQMGGEGAPWIGIAPFVEHNHVFQNVGDGTFFHSGSLALRALVASGLNITYKILYNGHVAMTGGQTVQGALPIPQLTRQLEAEGVRKTIILAEQPERWRNAELATNAQVRDRSELEITLAELEKIPGVTAIIYDQECAAEKRRMRSRGMYQEPTRRLMIHDEVCEGCGDCVKQSNCMSLTPIPTARGQKISIHQSSCNKDYSCVLGDCPSFVTVKIKAGTGLRRKALPSLPSTAVPAPRDVATVGDGYRIVCPGIGGTGVVTINALLATAAWIEGLHVSTLDQTGTAQKGGAVISHLLLSRKPMEVPHRINAGNADVVIGFDLLGVANPDNLRFASPDRTTAVLNTNLTPTIDVIRSRAPLVGPERMLEKINTATRRGRNIIVDGNRLAEGLFGTHLAVNLFMVGVAYQGGLIPLSLSSIEQAIRLNEVEVEKNLQVFEWGRKYYHDVPSVEAVLSNGSGPKAAASFDRVAELTAYQSAAYARQFSDFVAEVGRRAPALEETVSRYLYKLMAYKDEYEVARLLTRPEFEARVRETWAEVESISYNLHPPLLRSLGVHKKLALGPWFRAPLKMLAAMKFVRGGVLDIFSYGRHRRMERDLIAWYRTLIEQVIEHLAPENQAAAIEIAALPDQIRGYERIKEESIAKTKALAEEKLAQMRKAAAVSVS
ncbi:MAG TPA: indolepyruvate ferredoxin oxidoreductase family protein [Bryobacteraceae bacterium]|nr:indolepyruvate ferredoxin oxidoreductase family protein [Bryobacteraceae bacterium]